MLSNPTKQKPDDRRRLWLLLATAYAAYMLAHFLRLSLPPDLVADSLPSFLFPPVCFSLLGLLPRKAGGFQGRKPPLPFLVGATVISLFYLEGLAPLCGYGNADWHDAGGLILGSLFFLVVV